MFDQQVIEVQHGSGRIGCDRHPSARAKVRVTYRSGCLFFCAHCARKFGYIREYEDCDTASQ